MMREAPVRDTDPDPYSDMAAQANQVTNFTVYRKLGHFAKYLNVFGKVSPVWQSAMGG